MIEKRETIKKKLLLLCIAGLLALGGCAEEGRAKETQTPKECAEYAMESLKKLDLEAFNECSDNYVETYRNWIGIPREKEYRLFGELQQPGLKRGKRYKTNYELAKKIVEKMSWEIEEVREEGDKAQIDLVITNRDMQNVTGELEIRILENMTESAGSGIGELIRNALNGAEIKSELISIIDGLKEDEICTMEVTLQAYQEKGQWKIHVSQELVNGVMGNMMADIYSEDVEKRIEEQMKRYEDKMEEWGERVGEKWSE